MVTNPSIALFRPKIWLPHTGQKIRVTALPFSDFKTYSVAVPVNCKVEDENIAPVE